MKKMTIYYGSTTGTCETLASSIAQALGMSNDNVHNVTEMTKEDLENNDVLLTSSLRHPKCQSGRKGGLESVVPGSTSWFE